MKIFLSALFFFCSLADCNSALLHRRTWIKANCQAVLDFPWRRSKPTVTFSTLNICWRSFRGTQRGFKQSWDLELVVLFFWSVTDRLKIQGGILSTREWVGVVLFLKTSRLKLTALDIIQACLPRLETRHKVIALPACGNRGKNSLSGTWGEGEPPAFHKKLASRG